MMLPKTDLLFRFKYALDFDFMLFTRSPLKKITISCVFIGVCCTTISCGSNNTNNKAFFSDNQKQDYEPTTILTTKPNQVVPSNFIKKPTAIIQTEPVTEGGLKPLISKKRIPIRGLGFGKNYCWELVYGQKCLISNH